MTFMEETSTRREKPGIKSNRRDRSLDLSEKADSDRIGEGLSLLHPSSEAKTIKSA